MRTARDGETVGANRRARDRSEGPPTHEGIESALGPTATPPTRVGHLSPPARRAVEEFGRRERIVLEETATGHGPSGVTRSGRAADHGVSSGAEGPSITLSGRTRAANRESRDAGGDAGVGVSRQVIASSFWSQILWPFVALRPLRCQRGRVARPSAGDAQGRAACATSRSDEVRKEPRRPQREAGALGLLSAAGHSTAPRARRVIDSSAAAGAVGRRRRGGCRRPGGSSGGRGRGRGSPRSSSGPCP